jgi:hypothetical protein
LDPANPVTDATANVASEILEPEPRKPIKAENPSVPPAPTSVGLTRAAPAKEKKASDELAPMIFADSSKIEGWPKRGVSVTVYGSNPGILGCRLAALLARSTIKLNSNSFAGSPPSD